MRRCPHLITIWATPLDTSRDMVSSTFDILTFTPCIPSPIPPPFLPPDKLGPIVPQKAPLRRTESSFNRISRNSKHKVSAMSKLNSIKITRQIIIDDRPELEDITRLKSVNLQKKEQLKPLPTTITKGWLQGHESALKRGGGGANGLLKFEF